MSELVFYTNPQSRGRVARWMLEEVGQPYRTEYLEYMTSMKSASYLKINPMGKVPALVHGNEIVTELPAICAYLADAFPEAGLAPAPEKRASYYRWLFFGAGPFEAAVTNKALGVTISDKQRGFVGYGSLENVLDTVERAISASPYIAGEQFTAADVYMGSQIGFGLQFDTIEPRPAFKAYWQRIEDRPARKRADELDNAAVKTAQKD